MLALFVAGMTLYVYGYEHRGDADYAREERLGEVLVLAAAAALHIALGAVLRLWAIPALLLPVVIAIPAGSYPGGWPEMPVAGVLFFQEMTFGLLLVFLGIGIGIGYDRVVRRRRQGVSFPTTQS